jgi:hypothetical protein
VNGPWSDARDAPRVVVHLPARRRDGLGTAAGELALGLAGRGFDLGSAALRRGAMILEPAVQAAHDVGALLPQPPWAGTLRAEGAARLGAAAAALDRWATGALGGVADGVLARLDVAGLVRRRVDVDAIVADAVEHADLDAAAARLDVEAVVDRLDLTRIVLEQVDLRAVVLAVIERLDLTRIVLDHVDLGTVVTAAVDRTDLEVLTARVVDHVDLDAAAARLDLDAVAARLDVDAVVERLDLTRIVLEHVDLDAVVAAALDHLDLVALANEVIDGVDLPEIIRESTGSMASETVRSARMQGIHADEALERAVDRLLVRRRRRHPGDVDGVGSP